MSVNSGNTCNIITLFPMGVNCSVVNSTSPYNYDGSIYLTITGGTPPYHISWSNGAQTQFITGLQHGAYTSNVTDYYGDFSSTTTCTVSSNFAYMLEEFFNCTIPTQKIYYVANINQLYPTGDTFTISSQSGCWVSNGLVTNTGQTFYSYSAITTSGPFEDCTECLPVTPELESTSGLCLTTKIPQHPVGIITTQYQFYSAGTMNGYPTWTATTPNQKIYFNNLTNQWSVSGWTLNGIPVLTQNVSPPIGIWTVNGSARTVNVTQGDCGTEIITTIQKVNPTCSSASNGVIKVINVDGGTPPYTYSLNNIVYQNSNIFNNLQVGAYIIYVKDIIGNVGTGLSVLIGQQPITTYQINLTSSPVPSTFQIPLGEKNTDWKVTVNPPLPVNRSVSFTIYNTTTMSAGTANNASPTLIYSNTTGTTGTSQFVTSSTLTTTNSYPNTVLCHPNFYITGITRTYNVSLSGTGSVGGQILQKVVVVNNTSGCITKGGIKDTISIGNIVLNNQQTCEGIGNSVTPLTFSVYREGTPQAQQQNDNA